MKPAGAQSPRAGHSCSSRRRLPQSIYTYLSSACIHILTCLFFFWGAVPPAVLCREGPLAFLVLAARRPSDLLVQLVATLWCLIEELCVCCLHALVAARAAQCPLIAAACSAKRARTEQYSARQQPLCMLVLFGRKAAAGASTIGCVDMIVSLCSSCSTMLHAQRSFPAFLFPCRHNACVLCGAMLV